MNNFIQMKLVKCFNIYINPIIIGALFSSLGAWDYENDKFFLIKVVSVFVLLIWYIITSWKYYKIEENIQSDISSLNEQIVQLNSYIEFEKKKNSTYNKVILSLTSLFNKSADSINDIAKKLLNRNATLDKWNYKTVCVGICNGIYETLCVYSGYYDFSVSIMLYDINARGKSKNIRMIAEKSKYEGNSSIFDIPLNLNKYKDFYAVKMFKKSSPKISILTTTEDINLNFVFSDNSDEHPKYSQYVGIPILCSGKQMISLLQICAFDESMIADTKDKIMEIINEYILPFVYYALLNNKIEKGFLNSISMIKEVEQDVNNEKW